MSADYSLARARSSLAHFGFGKVASALTGVCVLVLVLRLVAPAEYGAYVALMAILEIFCLVSGMGLSYFAQRYVPELRLKGSERQFNSMLIRLLIGRIVLAVVFAIPLCAMVGYWSGWLNLSLPTELAGVFGVCLVFGAASRYIDELTQALLLQGQAQMQTLGANILRLAALSYVGLELMTIDLRWLLMLELVVTAAAATSGCVLLALYVRRRAAPPLGAGQHLEHRMPHAWRHSLRFHVALLLSQTYGLNAVKLFVTSIVGLQATAVFGYASSIVNILRTYSPAFLLSGWIRPLLVARYVAQRNVDQVRSLTRLVIGISLIGLIPFAIVFHLFGLQFTDWLGKGKYSTGAVLLAPLVLVVCLQAWHTVLSMVCATVETPSFVLWATVVCQLSVPVALWLTAKLGIQGTVLALALAEVLWLGAVSMLLARRFGAGSFVDMAGLGRAVLSGLGLAVSLSIAQYLIRPLATWQWLMASVATLGVYWLLVWQLKVIGPQERGLIGLFVRRRASTAP